MKVEYYNRLPHIAPPGSTFFVTFRLGDSLPQKIFDELNQEIKEIVEKLKKAKGKKEVILNQWKLYFQKLDHQLDSRRYGNCYLERPEIAKIVQDKLHELDHDKYDLICYTIMPNHVHALFDTLIQLTDNQGLVLNEIPKNYTQLDKIMKSIKGSSAYLANKELGRKGKFWQKDSYDHYVRDGDEQENIIHYILQNPVKAGIVKDWKDHPFTYLKENLIG